MTDTTPTRPVRGSSAARSTVDERTRTLVDTTYEALWRGIAALRPGNRLGDVSAAIAGPADRDGIGVIYEHDGHAVGGHGIGRDMHEDPMVPGRGQAGRGMRLRPGLVFAIEPMFTLGRPGFRLMDDGWTPAYRRRRHRRPLGAHGRRHRAGPLGAQRASRRAAPDRTHAVGHRITVIPGH